MSDVFKFPNGYDVTVCRKQDILDCLDANIIDKDVVLAVITQCELDASNFIKAGRWAGIPFLGSIRIPKRSLKLESTEVKTLLDDARQSMNTEQYMIFRQKLNADIMYEEKQERYYRYIVSHFVNNNRKYYVKLVKKHGEKIAQFICWTLSNLTIGAPIENY